MNFISFLQLLSNVQPDWRYTRYFWAYYIFIAWIKCLKMNVENFNSCKRIISKLSWPTQCNVHGLKKWLRVSGTWKWSTDHNCDKLLFSYTFLVLLLTKPTCWFELLGFKDNMANDNVFGNFVSFSLLRCCWLLYRHPRPTN